MKKFLIWLRDSNRWKHLVGGIIIYMILLMMAFAKIPISLVMAVAVLIVMLSMEYKDKAHGGLFDWVDVLVGIFCPLILGIILCLVL